jgi:alpha-amylase
MLTYVFQAIALFNVGNAQFSVFDAPLHYNFKQAAERGVDYDLRTIWDNTVVKNRPIDAV